MKNVFIAVIITVIIAGAGSFFGGIKYTQAKDAATRTQQMTARTGGAANGQFGQRAGGAGARGGSFINGSILSKDDKSVTIQLQGGGSKIILLSGSTTIGKTTDGTVSDLEVGKTVMVTGQPNTDGSVTAQSIQIRPAGLAPAGSVAPTSGQTK
jgi:hypothetical protein